MVIDALYCAKFMESIWQLGTPHVSVLYFYSHIFGAVQALIHLCTPNEIARIGRFYKEMFKVAERLAQGTGSAPVCRG